MRVDFFFLYVSRCKIVEVNYIKRLIRLKKNKKSYFQGVEWQWRKVCFMINLWLFHICSLFMANWWATPLPLNDLSIHYFFLILRLWFMNWSFLDPSCHYLWDNCLSHFNLNITSRLLLECLLRNSFENPTIPLKCLMLQCSHIIGIYK